MLRRSHLFLGITSTFWGENVSCSRKQHTDPAEDRTWVSRSTRPVRSSRIKEIEKFHSAMNEDFQNQFKNVYDQDQDYIHGEAHKQLETCFGFGLVIV